MRFSIFFVSIFVNILVSLIKRYSKSIDYYGCRKHTTLIFANTIIFVQYKINLPKFDNIIIIKLFEIAHRGNEFLVLSKLQIKINITYKSMRIIYYKFFRITFCGGFGHLLDGYCNIGLKLKKKTLME